MSVKRSVARFGVSVALALSLVGAAFAGTANATPVCTPTPSGTTCVDPTGSCLITIYPKFGPALCLRNPIGPIT